VGDQVWIDILPRRSIINLPEFTSEFIWWSRCLGITIGASVLVDMAVTGALLF